MTPSVVVVGGGMAGLATAYELHRQGVTCLLLEGQSRAGGVVLSEELDGFVIDAGPDALLMQKPEGIALCHELGLGDRLMPTKPPRLAFVQRAGRLHALPAASVLGIPTELGPFVRTRLFTWAGKARMAAELFISPRRDGGDESIGAFMRRRFGSEATTYLAEPLLAGIHAGDVDRLSVHALFPRFVEAERTHGSLLRAFRRTSAASAEQRGSAPGGRSAAAPGKDGAFRSLPGGLSELVRALERALPPDTLCLDSKATRLVHSPAGFRVEFGTGSSIEARAVVLATPAFATARLIRSLDPTLAALCDDIPYASVATVALGFRRGAVSHPLNGSGFVVPRVEESGILAGSWLSSKWAHRAPDDHVLMRTFVGGARDPRALDRSDEEIVGRSLSALTPLLGIGQPPLFTRVYRWERANAQHEVGHLARVGAIERALEGHPGLCLTGSAYRGVGIPDCVADARATARRLASWLATSTLS
jgi:oxygen-dependent protoporphyrinogen oxidase